MAAGTGPPKMHGWDDVCDVVPGGKPEHIGAQKTGTPGFVPAIGETGYDALPFPQV